MRKLLPSGIAGLVMLTAAAGMAMAADVAQAPTDSSESFIFSIIADGWAGGSFMSSRTGNADIEPHEDSLLVYGGDLRMGLLVSPGFYAQADLSAEKTNNEKDDNFNKAHSEAAHLAFRNQDFLFGGFVGKGNVWTEVDSDDHAEFDFRGVEFQYFTNSSVFYAQAGLFDNSDDLNYTHDGSFVRGQIQHFFGDSNKLTGQLAIASAESSGLSTDIVDWGLRFDKSFETSPVSVFVSYSGLYAGHSDGSFVDNVARVGLRFQFGSSGGQNSNATGATLDLPSFGRWVGAGNYID